MDQYTTIPVAFVVLVAPPVELIWVELSLCHCLNLEISKRRRRRRGGGVSDDNRKKKKKKKLQGSDRQGQINPETETGGTHSCCCCYKTLWDHFRFQIYNLSLRSSSSSSSFSFFFFYFFKIYFLLLLLVILLLSSSSSANSKPHVLLTDGINLIFFFSCPLVHFFFFFPHPINREANWIMSLFVPCWKKRCCFSRTTWPGFIRNNCMCCCRIREFWVLCCARPGLAFFLYLKKENQENKYTKR